MTQCLLTSIFIWPILALIGHMLIPKTAAKSRQVFQAGFSLIWLVLSLLLFFMGKQPLCIMMGSWPAPFGIALVLDQLSQLMLVIFAIAAVCINFYSYYDNQLNTKLNTKQQAFYAGFWLLLLGVSGAIFTADLFNLYVWFEVMLVSAFILLACTSQTKVKAIMHYATMNIMGTLVMLLAIALIYGLIGSLNYADIAYFMRQDHMATVWLVPMLVLLVFAIGVKAAVFPLYFWLPTAYTKPSSSATMLLASLITKVVMVTLLRLVWLWAPLQQPLLAHGLLCIALATMFFGVMGAANQFRMRSILAFHIISQLGYILLAICLPTSLAIAAAVYFLIHNIFVKTNLFMITGVIEQQYQTDDLKHLGAIIKAQPWLAAAFFIAAMSLAGFPPLSGFWGKLFIIKATLASHYYWSAAIAIIVSLFTLYSMIKLWRYVFCQPSSIKTNAPVLPSTRQYYYLCLAILPLLLLPMAMGLFPDYLLHYLDTIATQLSQPTAYIHWVLGANS